MIHLREQFWAMPVPEDAWAWIPENFRTDFVVNMGYLIYPKAGGKKWLYLPGMSGVKMPGLDYNERIKSYVKLPPGEWEVFCSSKDITDAQAADIVEKADEYFWKCSNGNRPHSSATTAFLCLIEQCGCNVIKGNYIIFKKK